MRPFDSFEDDELVVLLVQGDENAFTEIYERYWLKLYNESYKRLKDSGLCADIIQDIFADLWLKRAHRVIDNLAAYLFTAVRYRVFVVHRRSKATSAFAGPIEFIAAEASNPDSIFFEKEIRECIAIWLDMQPEKRKQVFVMKFGRDLSTREISEILHVSQKTVQNQFATSLKQLRVHLEKIMTMLF